VADLLCGELELIVNSHLHSFEVETTLDHGSGEDSFDPDYLDEEEDVKTTLCKNFSLECMTGAVNFYEEVNAKKTGQRKRWCSTRKHYFKRILHQNHIARFRRYREKHGTKKEKIDIIDHYVFDMFERARGNSVLVHEVDLHRWAMKKAMDESLHNFVSSRHWLHTFKNKHNIVSRKFTKVK
jgi:hypothetical protein